MSTTNAFLDPIKLAMKSLFFLVICVSAFANLLHANTAQKPLLIRSSGNDLEQLKSYESSLEPEQRIYQGVVDLSSDLGSKILEISLGEKKPGKLVFDRPATILITPHSYYSPDFSQAFLANAKEESEFHEKRVATNAKELREIFVDLQKEGAFEPMTDFGNIFLISSAHDLEKLSTTGFNRLQLEYSKFYAKHKNTIKAGAITTAVVAVAALGYIFRAPLSGVAQSGAEKIQGLFTSSESNSNNDTEYFEIIEDGINIIAHEPEVVDVTVNGNSLEVEFTVGAVNEGKKSTDTIFAYVDADEGFKFTGKCYESPHQQKRRNTNQQVRRTKIPFVPLGKRKIEFRNSKKAPSAPTPQPSAPAPQSEENANP